MKKYLLWLLLCPFYICSCSKLWQGPIAVKIVPDENAEITIDKEYLHYGDTLTVNVNPKHGYCCKELEPKEFFTQDKDDKTIYRGRVIEDLGNIIVQATISESPIHGVHKQITNGTFVLPEITEFFEDNLITFTVEPEKGYQITLDDIKVTDYPYTYIEYEVKLIPNSTDTFTFKMPGHPISITADCIPGLYLPVEDDFYYVEKGEDIDIEMKNGSYYGTVDLYIDGVKIMDNLSVLDNHVKYKTTDLSIGYHTLQLKKGFYFSNVIDVDVAPEDYTDWRTINLSVSAINQEILFYSENEVGRGVINYFFLDNPLKIESITYPEFNFGEENTHSIQVSQKDIGRIFVLWFEDPILKNISVKYKVTVR